VGRSAAAFRWLSRLRGAELPGEVAAVVVIALLAAAGCLLVTRVRVSGQEPVGLLVAVSAAYAVLAAVVFATGPRLSRAGLHVAIVALVLGIAVLGTHARTVVGLMTLARAFQWLAVYAALFLRPREARWHALGITVACVATFGIAGLPDTAIQAVFVCATVWVGTLMLSALSEGLRTQADTDNLTGLLNRSGFTKAADREHALAGRTGAPLSLALLDLDGFKHVNDRHGHVAGDRMLADVAAAWTRTLRPGDVLARYGGDEFVVMFPATSAEEAHQALARLHDAHPARWSAGVAEWARGETLADCIARADGRLYEAKAAGRDGQASVMEITAARA